MPEQSELTFISAAEYRQKIAGLIDPEAEVQESEREKMRQTAVKIISTAARLFGEELDPKTRWTRVATAIESAIAKTIGSDHEFFLQQILQHVKADPDKASSDAELADLLEEIGSWSASEKQRLIAFMSTHLFAMLSYARNNRLASKKAAKKGDAQ